MTEVIISEKTTFRWPVLVAVAGLVAMGAVNAAQTRADAASISDHDDRIRKLEVYMGQNETAHAYIKDQLSEQNRKLDRVTFTLDRIDSKLAR